MGFGFFFFIISVKHNHLSIVKMLESLHWMFSPPLPSKGFKEGFGIVRLINYAH